MCWLDWLFQQPSAPWQWIGIIVGMVAFVGFIVSLPIIFCGRPKIIVGFNIYDVQDGNCMICEIWNEPITKGILSFLKVHRDPAQDVIAFFTVKERATGRIIPKTRSAVLIKTQARVRAERVALPASLIPSSFIVALVNKKNGQVVLEDKETKLQIGEYIVDVIIESEGRRYLKTGILIIESKYPFAYWDTNS